MPAQNAQEFTSVTNDQLYDTWASTYDSDGNVLQAVDDLELQTMLPDFVQSVGRDAALRRTAGTLRLLDFGCGTGRNTMKLLQADWDGMCQSGGGKVEVWGWDGSEAMLEVARKKVSSLENRDNVTISGFQRMAFSDPAAISPECRDAFDGVISTLVLEHLPLDAFFAYLAALLKPDAYALITNMHPDMGRTTKAGYKTTGGERVKGVSFVHGVKESVQAAHAAGFDIVSAVRERAVDEEMMSRDDVGERGKKWVGVSVWYGFLIRKRRAT